MTNPFQKIKIWGHGCSPVGGRPPTEPPTDQVAAEAPDQTLSGELRKLDAHRQFLFFFLVSIVFVSFVHFFHFIIIAIIANQEELSESELGKLEVHRSIFLRFFALANWFLESPPIFSFHQSWVLGHVWFRRILSFLPLFGWPQDCQTLYQIWWNGWYWQGGGYLAWYVWDQYDLGEVSLVRLLF